MLLETKSRHWENGIEHNLGIVKLHISLALFTTAGHYIISDLPHVIDKTKKRFQRPGEITSSITE